jgi:hypothetical protein
VLVLAAILNPRAKRRARLAGRVEIPRGCDGDAGGNHDGVKTITPTNEVLQDEEKDHVP